MPRTIKWAATKDALDWIKLEYELTTSDLIKAGLLERVDFGDPDIRGRYYNFIARVPDPPRRARPVRSPIHPGRWGSSP